MSISLPVFFKWGSTEPKSSANGSQGFRWTAVACWPVKNLNCIRNRLGPVHWNIDFVIIMIMTFTKHWKLWPACLTLCNICDARMIAWGSVISQDCCKRFHFSEKVQKHSLCTL